MAIVTTYNLHITAGGIYRSGSLVLSGNYSSGFSNYNNFANFPSETGGVFGGTIDGSIGKGSSKLSTWTHLGNKTDGMSSPIIFIIGVADGRIYYANETHHFYTDDDFSTVTNIGSYPITGQPKAAVYIDSSIVLTTSSTGKVAISTDNCETWEEVSGNPPAGITSINCMAVE
jgi:hypothetical protein